MCMMCGRDHLASVGAEVEMLEGGRKVVKAGVEVCTKFQKCEGGREGGTQLTD